MCDSSQVIPASPKADNYGNIVVKFMEALEVSATIISVEEITNPKTSDILIVISECRIKN